MAWITPLVAIALVALVANVAKVGPFGPGASSPGSLSPSEQVATDRSGDFELTLRSDKTHYLPNEPIEVAATLAYLGAGSTIEYSHDSTGPIHFGIREKVFGKISVGGVSLLMCARSTLERNRPLVQPFRKGGGFSGDGADAEALKAWIQDPVLRLPRGTWHLFASSHAPCMSDGPSFSLHAEIVIVVDDDPGAPVSDATPVPVRGEPVYGGADIGDFQLQLKSGRSTYQAGDAIDFTTVYRYASGVKDSITISHLKPEVTFSILQVSNEAQAVVPAPVVDASCREVTLLDGVDRSVPIDASNVDLIKAVSWPESTVEALVEGVLKLPIGRWRIVALVEATLGPCANRGEARHMTAAVEFDVVGADQAEIQLAVGPLARTADGRPICLTALGGGVLRLNPRTGLGFTDPNGTDIDVIWPDGYSARFQDGVAILIDESGHVVARVGDEITKGGGYTADNVFHVCGAGMQG